MDFRVSKEVNESIYNSIRGAKRITLTTHIRPDGDGVGSMLGLAFALEAIQKEVQMVSIDGIPSSYKFLSGAEKVIQKGKDPFGLIIVLDCSDPTRFNGAFESGIMPDINIDHHITNEQFGKINLVDPGAVATSEIVAAHFNDWGLKINKPVADALLTGIIMDTIGFRTSNMSPRALRVSAGLMESGADLPDLYSRVLLNRSYEALKYWGEGLTKMERKGPIVWTELSADSRQKTNYPGKDDADLINLLSTVKDASVQIMFVEQNDNLVKISWRSYPGIDVSAIAQHFGGGGHPAAAGAQISGTMENVKEIVIKTTQGMLFSKDKCSL
jgi:phosphoesterase RecJ-like protein